MKQIRLKIDTTISDSVMAGKALKIYKEEGTEREAIKLALGTLYGALAIAKEGGTLEEVKTVIQENKIQFELLQSLALSLVEIKLSSNGNRKIIQQNQDCQENVAEIPTEDFMTINDKLQLDDEEL